MKYFVIGQKVGLGIMLIIGIIMAALVIIGKPIPDLIAWLFFAGCAVTLLSSLLRLIKR